MDRLMGLTPHRPSSVGSSLIIVNAQKIMVECAINIIANKKGAKMKLEKKMKTAPRPKRLQRTNKVRRNFLSKTLAGCRNIRKRLTTPQKIGNGPELCIVTICDRRNNCNCVP